MSEQNRFSNQVVECAMQLQQDLEGSADLHRQLINKYEVAEPHQLIVYLMLEQGKIIQPNVFELINLLDRQILTDTGNSQSLTAMSNYSQVYYEQIEKVSRIIDGIRDFEYDAQRAKLELIRKQLKRFVNGESISPGIAEIYQQAKNYRDWEYIMEIVNEFYPDLFEKLVKRNPYLVPYNTDEVAKILSFFPGLDSEARDLIKRWLEGEFDLQNPLKEPEYTLDILLPPEPKNTRIDFPPELLEGEGM